MRPALYRYNAETCQYERVRLKPLAVFTYVFSLALTAVAMLAGLLIFHDFIFDSDKEIALRNENRALQRNYATLTGDLLSIEDALAKLGTEDQRLHVKFFGSGIAESEDRTHIADQNILLGGADGFRKAASALGTYSGELIRRSNLTSSWFGKKLSISPTQAGVLTAMPTSQPVQPWDSEKLISGFGPRIDPFHKGRYEHSGIDIALPRGTEVVSTAPGKISVARKSSIPAGYGNYIEIDHGGGFVTRYAHLEDLKVRQGQWVEKGVVIGTIGNSGGSIAPHLHYEIIRDGTEVDPVPYMIQGISTDEHHRLIQLSKIQNQSLD